MRSLNIAAKCVENRSIDTFIGTIDTHHVVKSYIRDFCWEVCYDPESEADVKKWLELLTDEYSIIWLPLINTHFAFDHWQVIFNEPTEDCCAGEHSELPTRQVVVHPSEAGIANLLYTTAVFGLFRNNQ